MKQLVPCDGALDDVRFRPYGLTDRPLVEAMSARLTGQSLYQRFFSGTPKIPEMYLRRLATMDHWDHDAIVALVYGELVGIAEYVRDRNAPDHADIGILVADCWQRRGLSGQLVVFLAELAGRRGIREFDAEVLLDNRGGQSAVLRGWPTARPEYDGGAAHYRLPLPVLHD